MKLKQPQINKSEKPIKTLPWGEKVFLEIPIFKYRNQLLARYGENVEGRKYIEFSKFGPLPAGAKRSSSKQQSGTYSQRLRIYKPHHWGTIKHVCETTLFPAIGWSKNSSQTQIELSVLQKLTKQIKSKSEELAEKKKVITELMNNISFYRDQNIKNRVPEFTEILKEFKKIVGENHKESVYQKFLKNHFWIFGLEYVSAKSQKQAGAKNRPDFSLERYDKFRDIVEIKRPHDEVFVKKANRYHQGQKLKEALAEVMDYVDYFLTHINDEIVEFGETYYKPRAIIVIGRTKEFGEKVRQLNSFLHRIEVVTYDELIERAEKIIEFYQK